MDLKLILFWVNTTQGIISDKFCQYFKLDNNFQNGGYFKNGRQRIWNAQNQNFALNFFYISILLQRIPCCSFFQMLANDNTWIFFSINIWFTKLTQKLTTIGHHTTFNKEKIRYEYRKEILLFPNVCIWWVRRCNNFDCY